MIVQRTLAVLAAAALATGTSGCFASKKKDSQPGVQPPVVAAPQTPTPWKLVLQSRCDSVAEQCVANYGFTVYGDGRYQVGPGPQGQQVSGSVSDDEIKGLQAALTKVLTGAGHLEAAADTCKSGLALDSEDSLTYSKQSPDTLLVHTNGSDLCGKGASADDAEALHTAIRGLAAKYYLLPFPDACADAALAVTSQYDALQNCSTDDDCSYIDADFGPIPKTSLQYVTVDNCSVVKPLVVGNITAVFNAQSKLQDALSNARNICSYRIVRSECTGLTGFQSDAGKPVCSAGKCRINPAIGY